MLRSTSPKNPSTSMRSAPSKASGVSLLNDARTWRVDNVPCGGDHLAFAPRLLPCSEELEAKQLLEGPWIISSTESCSPMDLAQHSAISVARFNQFHPKQSRAFRERSSTRRSAWSCGTSFG